MSNRQKVLLLGAGGFIGSHLATELLKTKNYDITALDISEEKLDEGLRQAAEVLAEGEENAEDILKIVVDHIKYVEMDVLKKENKERIENLVKEHDIIVNMIAICNPALYVSNPILTFEVGFKSNLEIAELCAKHHKRLIQFSTCEVYGKSPSVYVPDKKFLFNEETSNLILGPINKHRWIYACGKQLLERVIHAYGLRGDLKYSIIRPFNYIGERIDYLPSKKEGNPRVFSHFMDNLMLGKPLKLVNGGKQRRCYMYIRDATGAHIRIINNEGNRCHNQIFNVGVLENETTIENLASQMREIYKEHFMENGQELSELASMPGDEFYGKGYDDIDRRAVDNSKLKKLTGWQPKYDLKTTLYNIMKYYIDGVRKRKQDYERVV